MKRFAFLLVIAATFTLVSLPAAETQACKLLDKLLHRVRKCRHCGYHKCHDRHCHRPKCHCHYGPPAVFYPPPTYYQPAHPHDVPPRQYRQRRRTF